VSPRPETRSALILYTFTKSCFKSLIGKISLRTRALGATEVWEFYNATGGVGSTVNVQSKPTLDLGRSFEHLRKQPC